MGVVPTSSLPNCGSGLSMVRSGGQAAQSRTGRAVTARGADTAIATTTAMRTAARGRRPAVNAPPQSRPE